MLTFLLLAALAIAAVTVGGALVIPIILFVAVMWLITLPFRLFFALLGGVFRLVFGLLGGLLWILFAPFRILGGRRHRVA